MFKAGFIGAGRRAQAAHYPSVSRLADVSIEAVAELDESRMQACVEQYGIPRSFTNHREMLDTTDLDLVYVIMNSSLAVQPALDCMNAGKHVFIEKPAGGNVRESEALLQAAVDNNVYCMVGFQRRYADVTREAMRRVAARGPATLAIAEFHKPGSIEKDVMDQFWSDVCHVVDLVRFMVNREAEETTSYQTAQENGRYNSFNSIIRFAGGAVGIVTASRTSGGRYLRSELHGPGIGCYMRLPEEIEILEARAEPRRLTGAEVEGKKIGDEPSYEGVLNMHQHFVECIHRGEVPCSDIRDVIHTSRLVDRLGGDALKHFEAERRPAS